jgi:signal transduction histidine kinase/CheY-like chemotaxis protein
MGNRASGYETSTAVLEAAPPDLAAYRRLEEQYRQAQKMEAVGRLAAGIAHDFNNLLTVIRGYTELLLSGTRHGDPAKARLEEIHRAGERATALTRQLLAFSRKQMAAPVVLDLNALVDNLTRMLRRLIGEDVELTTVPARDLHPVSADPGQLEQVVMNLAVNARDAMPTGGKLTIETANITFEPFAPDGPPAGSARRDHRPEVPPGPYAMLAVSDTGVGMSPEVRARLFEPFFTTKQEGQGTGLGLAMTYAIVKQSGGFVYAYSEPGRGSTFKVYLPRAQGPTKEAPAAPPAVLPRGTETVLLAEDEAEVRRVARVALEMRGYRVLEAATGGQALRLAEQAGRPVQLLLTDVIMPGMSGRELAEVLRQRDPGLKVLFVSGYANEAIVRHGLLTGSVHFLQKPFTPVSLARKVREVLDGGRVL